MLPYTPLHHLLFAGGAPARLVMTSGNRSNEPIAFDDDDARRRLAGIADAFLLGERPIARRLDDSVVRTGLDGPVVLRRSRGLAPGAGRRACPRARRFWRCRRRSQERRDAGRRRAGVRQVRTSATSSTTRRSGVSRDDRRSARHVRASRLTTSSSSHDPHPAVRVHARMRWRCLPRAHVAVQHHRAHVASVLAERGALDTRVVGVAFDGTGYGDDGSIWGGEFFVGRVRDGFDRVASHLRPAMLAGGDAAARHPVQAAAGFLSQLDSRAGSPRTAVWFHVPLRRCAAARRARRAGVRDDVGGTVVRLRGGAARLHAADRLRRAGRDVARASRARRH